MRILWATALLVPSAAFATIPRTPLAAEPIVLAEGQDRLVVKWRDDLRARVVDADVEFGEVVDRRALDSLVASWDVRFEPLISVSEPRLRELERRAEARSGRQQPDLAGMHRVVILDPTPARLLALGDALQALPQVEFVTAEPHLVPPPIDIAPTTPDHTPEQGYLGADPGIDAEYAWTTWGLSGAGVHIRDCEYGWDVEHEDLEDRNITIEAGQTWPGFVVENGWHHHGTAVAGELVGQDNGYGVTGITPGSEFSVYPEWSIEEGGRRVDSVTNAIADSVEGDIVLLEMQTGGPDGRFAPAELNQAIWTVVRTGVDAGINVVAAAGNGSADLDSKTYAAYAKRGDSGAIIVGAGSNDVNHERLSFSTYGSRVDVQGWGTGVFTTGYGSFAMYGDDSRQAYTATFNGTSSASPIVTGAAALLVEASRRYREDPIAPDALRDLLVQTGIPATGGQIGPFPDMEAALLQLEADLDVPPAVDSVLADPANPIEGDTVTLTVMGMVLPVHTPRYVWNAVDDGRELGTGNTLEVVALDNGPLEVDVTVLDDWDRESTERVTVEVTNAPPVVTGPTFSGERLEGSALQFAGSATDVGPQDTLEFEWSVNGVVVDGSEPMLSYTFADDGDFTVGVVAVDDDGGRSESRSVDVAIENVVPTMVIEVATAPEIGREGVLFVTVTDPGDDNAVVAWDLGDGSEATGLAVEHVWRERGTVTVTATLTDEDGSEVVETLALNVQPPGCGCSQAGRAATGWWLLTLGLLGVMRRRAS